MSKSNSLLVDKNKMPLAMGLAFVAFTTQFGGGFASGAQIYQYFINYGHLVSDPSGSDPGAVRFIFLVRDALCLQA